MNPSASSAALVADSHESSLFAVRSIGDAMTSAAPPTAAKLAVAIPSSASGVIEMTGDLAEPAPLTSAVLGTDPRGLSPNSVAPVAEGRAAWWMLGGLTAAVLTLAGVIVTSEPPTVIVRSPAAVASTADSGRDSVTETPAPATDGPDASKTLVAASVAASEPDDERVASATSGDDAEDRRGDGVSAPAPEPTSKSKPKSKSKSKSKSKATSKATSKAKARKGSGSSQPNRAASTQPKASQSTAPAAKPKRDGMPSVDCVLDPSKCPRGAAPKTAAGSSDAGAGPVAAKLTAAQLRTGLAAAKPAAKQCGRNHGIAPGTGVKVKLSIQNSGTISGATVLGEHANTALAACIGAAAKKATFPRFGNAVMGAVYTFRL